MTSNHSLTRTCTKLNNKLVNAQLEHFQCQNEPRASSNSQNSPQPRLKGNHHFPPYNIFCASPRIPHPNGILSKIPKFGTLATLGPYNFACKPPIEMKSKASLQPLFRAFQQYIASHLHTRKLGRFPTFNGWESNCQFASRPFFWP